MSAKNRHPEIEIPEWAPVITCKAALAPFLGGLAFDYASMAELVEDEGIAKEELGGLWIHAIDGLIAPKFGWPPVTLGGHISKRLLSNHPSSDRYRNYLSGEIGGIRNEDLDNTSFILLAVGAALTFMPEKTDRIAEIRLTLINGLLYFTGELLRKTEISTMKPYDKYTVLDRMIEEHRRVRVKEQKIAETGSYRNILTAVITER